MEAKNPIDSLRQFAGAERNHFVRCFARRARLARIGLLCLLAVLLPSAALAQVQRTMVNPGFELPDLGTTGCYKILPDAQVPGWTTNATAAGSNDGTCAYNSGVTTAPPIELWVSGWTGVPARSGKQLAELNAWGNFRLNQNVCFVAGETVSWQLSHRGRDSAILADVMDFLIGGTQIARISTANDGNPSSVTASLGTANSAAAASGWVDYSGSFTVPAGSGGVQALGFSAVSVGGTSISQGNFLDNITITLRPIIQFSSATYKSQEGQTVVVPQLTVLGTVPVGGTTVSVTVGAATATSGSDFTVGTYTIPAGTYDTPTTLPMSGWRRVGTLSPTRLR
jgi:hypothetical protein